MKWQISVISNLLKSQNIFEEGVQWSSVSCTHKFAGLIPDTNNKNK